MSWRATMSTLGPAVLSAHTFDLATEPVRWGDIPENSHCQALWCRADAYGSDAAVSRGLSRGLYYMPAFFGESMWNSESLRGDFAPAYACRGDGLYTPGDESPAPQPLYDP